MLRVIVPTVNILISADLALNVVSVVLIFEDFPLAPSAIDRRNRMLNESHLFTSFNYSSAQVLP